MLDDENNTADSSATSQYRLNYLRGDRSHEITTTGSGLYRARDGILGDIVDASPTWVGPPTLPYTATWSDHLQTSATMPENTGTQSYLQYVTAEQTRLNVVYAGANDGLLHGFRAGSFDSGGNFCGTPASSITCSSTPNDGQEVFAYMPGSVLYSPARPNAAGACAGTNITTGTVVQNIHGWTPSITPSNQCETPELDYSATPYGHNFFVDATPGNGDLFYNGTWHSWLVGTGEPAERRFMRSTSPTPVHFPRVGQPLRPSSGGVARRNSHRLRQRDHRLRQQSRQYVRHAPDPAPAQWQLGSHIRQWLR